MQNPLALSLLSSLLFLIPACGSQSKEEAAAAEALELMERFVTTLEGVKDEASANAAAKKLEPIVARMQELSKIDKTMSEAEREKLEAKYKERGEALQKRMMQVMMKVMTDEKIGPVLAPVLEQMGR